MKKYELTGETKLYNGRTLHRIVALRNFGNVEIGDKGGWIEKEENLSQDGECWIYGNAKVYNNAKVCDNAKVYDDAEVCGSANVWGNAKVWVNAEVWANVKVCGNANVRGNAEIYNNKDYIVFKNWWSSGRYFTWTRSNNMWSVGCFYGSGDELIKKAYADSEDKGKHYAEIVNYVNNCVLGNKYSIKNNNKLEDFIDNPEKIETLYKICFYDSKYHQDIEKYIPASNFKEAYKAACYIMSIHTEYSEIKQIKALHKVTIIPRLTE